MKKNPSLPLAFRYSLAGSLALTSALACVPTVVQAADRQQPPMNLAGAPVRDAKGEPINYSRESLTTMNFASGRTPRADRAAGTARVMAPNGFVPATTGAQQPFWQYSVMGSGIGSSNIVIAPAPAEGGAPEIILGGNSGSGFGANDFWHVLRRNSATANYEQLFVSPLYTATVNRIGLANVMGDSMQEIVVMLGDGRIYLYDFATKTELGYITTGIGSLTGLSLTDLDGDGRAELIVTNTNDLFVFNGAGSLLWQVPGAGGYDVVAGQMDNDPAVEIATTSGKVVDASTRAAQWTRSGGFGSYLKLAPLPGENYQQLIAAQGWDYVYSYDVASQLPRWSISVFDIDAIQVADVDNDGTPEVIIGDGQWGSAHVHDLITQSEKWKVNNPEHGVTNIAVGDVDGDGVTDLLFGAGWTSTGADYLYVADTISRTIKWQSVDLVGPFLGPLIGDLDGDGQPELVVCSYESKASYDSGRILVFDLATLTLRGMSPPVVNNYAWTGVHDLKLRDLEGDGRMEIVIAADYLYDGVIEIYAFDLSNTFTRKWTNTTRPDGSPFNFVEVTDLDGNGTPEIIGANTVAHTGSEGVYVYIYDYASNAAPWRSVNMASGFSLVSGLVVQDLNNNGSKEIAALVGSGDLYTFDGPSRQLRNLRQSTGFTLLSNRAGTSGLIGGDSARVGHFLQYGTNSYSESFARQLGSTALNGINLLSDDALWTGDGSVLNLRLPPYTSVAWQSPAIGTGFGRFVATDLRNGQSRVFSSARHAVVGLTYTLPQLTLLSAASRKTHGEAGTFDVPLPLTGALGVECRGSGGTHRLVFTFSDNLVGGDASVTAGTGTVSGAPSFSGNRMIVNLSGVTDAQKITVRLSGVTDSTFRVLPDTDLTMGVLQGDANGNGTVSNADVSGVKGQVGATLSSSNFRNDVGGNGIISNSDVSATKGHVGSSLP